MPMDDELEQYEKLIQLIRETFQQDSALREKYQVGDKFRFVRDRLEGLLSQLESQRPTVKEKEQHAVLEDTENKVVVYVYLYNAHGLVFRSWSAMLTPKVFYEYSVNRPIYTEKNHVELLIKGKSNRQQHGFLAVRVNQAEIISPVESQVKDSLGNPVIKVKEGSLRFENLISFTHNDLCYTVNAQGEFILL
jgi:hypothetical protein